MICAWGALSFAISFFAKKFYVMNYCHKPEKVLGVSQHFRSFYGMLFVAWIVGMGSFGLMTKTSITCGPFKDAQSSIPGELLDIYWKAAPPLMTTIVGWAQIFVWFALLIVVIFAIYLSQRRKFHHLISSQLKIQLAAEKEEKKSLIKDFGVTLS